MSGGSFDYLYDKLDNEPLGIHTLELLERMVEWLKDAEQNQPDAASELAVVHQYLVATRQAVHDNVSNNRALLNLVKEAEWWCSNDSGQDDFEGAWEIYKKTNPAEHKR